MNNITKGLIGAFIMLVLLFIGVFGFIGTFGSGLHSIAFGIFWGALIGHFGAKFIFAWQYGRPSGKYGRRF